MAFDEVDRLIIDKWSDISELVGAYETVREKLRLQLEAVAEQLRPWAAKQELELTVDYKGGEFSAYQKAWLSEGRDEPWATIAVGSFSVEDTFGGEGGRLYACVYCVGGGKRKRLSKDAFGKALRESIGPQLTASWSEDIDRSCPLNRYLTGATAKQLVLDADKLTSFMRDQFAQLLELVEPVSTAIQKGLDAGSNRVE
jgi:hypothetical protein